ncbi:hypothetical protein ACVWY2_009873 [Bradyrhizobium sp. JR6.1]
MDEDGRQHQRGNICDVAPDGLGLQARASCRAVVERNGQASIRDRKSAEQCFTAHGAAVMSGEIGQRCGEGIIAERTRQACCGGL